MSRATGLLALQQPVATKTAHPCQVLLTATAACNILSFLPSLAEAVLINSPGGDHRVLGRWPRDDSAGDPEQLGLM